MEPFVKLALERWAIEYNKTWEQKASWDQWLRANQNLPSVKALLARSEVGGAKA